jgi:soluble lytic murein transglycosylase-like protein
MMKTIIGAMAIGATLFVSGCNMTTSDSMNLTSDLPYNNFVVAAANENGIDPKFVHQIIRIESRHRPNVTGKAGEIGLMQIKLQTARGVGYTGTRSGLYDPETNIRYGVRYLGEAKRRASGDRCKAAMLYNQGVYATRFSAGAKKYCNRVISG